jgi:hypothetical protein
MTWKLGGHRIYVEKDSDWIIEPRKGTVDELDTNYTHIHTAGRRSQTRKITFVVFSGYGTNIKPLIDDSTTTFEDEEGNIFTVSIMNVPSPERVYNYRDSMDNTEIIRTQMELMEVT